MFFASAKYTSEVNVSVHHARTPARKGDHSGGPSDTATSAPARELRFPPRGMSRVEAAYYVGISPSLFDTMVKDGRMPGPKLINTRTIWQLIST